MLKLALFNFTLIVLASIVAILYKKYVRCAKCERLLFIIAPIVTIACHYSSLIYHHFTDGKALEFLSHNPNLILPIYPCNVVMWCALILGFMKNKESRVYQLLVDYVFWFGIISTLVGMFANVDFIRNPTLSDFDVTKGIVAHATLFFNVILLPVFGKVKISLKRNMRNILISIIGMYVIGLYCNLVFRVIASADVAYQVNSMFIIHSPFAGLDFLTYPTIALLAVVIYFAIFHVAELISHPKGERWYDAVCSKVKGEQIFEKRNNAD